MVLNMLFDNYDLLMDSPNSTVTLRKLILQHAVQGKLVEQDPTDEPADELLKRIKAEKEKLITKGKIKKQKPLPEIAEEETPFEIPNGWVWARLGNIFDIQDYLRIPVNIAEREQREGPYPYYGANGQVGVIDDYIFEGERVLLAEDGGFFSDPIRGVAYIVNGRFWVNNHAHVLECLGGTCAKFWVSFFNRMDWGPLVRGMTRAKLNQAAMVQIPLALPPLAEQHRIVAKVDQLMQLCDQLDAYQKKASSKYTSLNDAALETLLSSETIEEFAEHWQFLCNNFELIYNDPSHVNKLRRAILQLAVQGKLSPQDPNDEPASKLLKRIKSEKEKLITEGKIKKQKPLPPITEDEIPYELPEGWEWVRLGEIGKTQTGSTPPTSKREYYGNDYAFIKPADISGQGIRYNNGEGLSKKGIEKGRFIKAYSVLMVCIGGSIGKVNFVDRDCSCNQQINAVTPYNDVDFCLVNYNLASPYFQNQVLTNAPSTTLPILSKGKWENIPFPLPPLAEQKRIVSKADQLMHLCDELETRLNQSKKDSEMLMQAVLYEAFS
ncbi:restriction endonuclease subunit S [Patescibacteria group bacterium]|nr:restriction endonuclease subunit S [Patescibacteria group bacterium]